MHKKKTDRAHFVDFNLLVTNLQVRAVVLGDEGAVALTQHRDLLLNVFDLVLRFLQVYDLDGHHFLGAIVDAFEHLAKRTLANALQLGEQLLRVSFGILAVDGRGGTKQGEEKGGGFLKEKGAKKKKIKGAVEKN